MYDVVTRMARSMALIGGLVLTALILLVCLSVLGRSGNTIAHMDGVQAQIPWLSDLLLSLGVGPVPGDFEIVEAGIAFSIFAFLPICQLRGGHATVDVFTSFLPKRSNGWLRAFWEIMLMLAIVLITWRLGVGLADKISTGETTLLLGFPKWWGYAASLLAAVTASFVAIYCSYARVIEAVSGTPLMDEEGAAH